MKNENGALFIEAALVLPIFMMAILSFVFLISLYTTHDRIQYAITQTANETATYAYFYEYMGVRAENAKLQNANSQNWSSTDKAVGNVKDIINKTSSTVADFSGVLSGQTDYNTALDNMDQNLESIDGNIDDLELYVEDIKNNPKQLITMFLSYTANSAVETGKDYLAPPLYESLTYKYLDTDEETLKKSGVKNVSFAGSKLLMQFQGESIHKSLNNRIIDVTITYDYTLPFSVLPESVRTFHIVQRSVAIAWCGDDNDTNKK